MSKYTVGHISSILSDPDPLANRLRGKYTTGGVERTFPSAPIQIAAAVEIDRLNAEIAALLEAVRILGKNTAAWRERRDAVTANNNSFGAAAVSATETRIFAAIEALSNAEKATDANPLAREAVLRKAVDANPPESPESSPPPGETA